MTECRHCHGTGTATASNKTKYNWRSVGTPVCFESVSGYIRVDSFLRTSKLLIERLKAKVKGIVCHYSSIIIIILLFFYILYPRFNLTRFNWTAELAPQASGKFETSLIVAVSAVIDIVNNRRQALPLPTLLRTAAYLQHDVSATAHYR